MLTAVFASSASRQQKQAARKRAKAKKTDEGKLESMPHLGGPPPHKRRLK